MATARPLPPYLPETQEQFVEHVVNHPTEWYQYCQAAYAYNDYAAGATELNEKFVLQGIRVTELEEKLQATQFENTKLQGKIESVAEQYTKQLESAQQKIVAAEVAKEKALTAAQPAVFTPPTASQPEPPVKTPADTPARAPPPAPSVSTESTRQSEKLPDPDKFNGERSDLRRFVSQIHEKLIVNRDRFPTPQARMAYVTNRLSGTPYAQVLPYIRHGVCQLSDYSAILHILERAYGDPNRIDNARSELMRYKQANKEFSAFFAEFQRLGLEGEMNDESLSILLEQHVSKELKGMLVHSPPASREYHALAAHLQDLENRRRYYEQASVSNGPKTFAAVASSPANAEIRRETRVPVTRERVFPSGDPMDLGSQRHRQSPNRREAGTCYRCGSKDHFVRQCSLPDNRPESVQRHDIERRRVSEVTRYVGSPTGRPTSPLPPPNGRRSPVLPAPRPTQAYYPPSPTLSNNTFSGNGVGLVEVASRS